MKGAREYTNMHISKLRRAAEPKHVQSVDSCPAP